MTLSMPVVWSPRHRGHAPEGGRMLPNRTGPRPSRWGRTCPGAEAHHLEPVILTGEAPDLRAVPMGCRFHPRCPLVATGEAERLGILHRCRGEDLGLALIGGAHAVACHARS